MRSSRKRTSKNDAIQYFLPFFESVRAGTARLFFNKNYALFISQAIIGKLYVNDKILMENMAYQEQSSSLERASEKEKEIIFNGEKLFQDTNMDARVFFKPNEIRDILGNISKRQRNKTICTINVICANKAIFSTQEDNDDEKVWLVIPLSPAPNCSIIKDTHLRVKANELFDVLENGFKKSLYVGLKYNNKFADKICLFNSNGRYDSRYWMINTSKISKRGQCHHDVQRLDGEDS